METDHRVISRKSASRLHLSERHRGKTQTVCAMAKEASRTQSHHLRGSRRISNPVRRPDTLTQGNNISNWPLVKVYIYRAFQNRRDKPPGFEKDIHVKQGWKTKTEFCVRSIFMIRLHWSRTPCIRQNPPADLHRHLCSADVWCQSCAVG